MHTMLPSGREFEWRRVWLALALAASLSLAGRPRDGLAQEAKPPEAPRVALAVPLGAAWGGATKITVRGWRLEAVTAARVGLEGAAVKILSQGKAPVPGGQDAQRVGDTQLELEVTLPAAPTATTAPAPTPDALANAAPATLSLVLATAAGESPPWALLVGDAAALAAEREPNDGFAEAQAITPGKAVEGQLHAPKNVDVYALAAAEGERYEVEIIARRHGSALDGLLTVYGPGGALLATNDDHAGGADSRLAFACAAAGSYYLCVQDAHDQGGPAHPYRLRVTRAAP